MNGSHLEYFHFFGRLLAKAIFDRQMVDLPLCKVLYKHILGIKPRLSDLKDIDQTYHRSLTWMKDNDITGVIMETFTVMRDEFGVMREIELCEGGLTKDVTDENKGEWLQLKTEFVMTASIRGQLDAFIGGLHEVCPPGSIGPGAGNGTCGGGNCTPGSVSPGQDYSPDTDACVMTHLLNAIGADGINGDTMNNVPEAFADWQGRARFAQAR